MFGWPNKCRINWHRIDKEAAKTCISTWVGTHQWENGGIITLWDIMDRKNCVCSGIYQDWYWLTQATPIFIFLSFVSCLYLPDGGTFWSTLMKFQWHIYCVGVQWCIHYHLCSICREDCESWWLPDDCSSMVEHWELKPEALGLQLPAVHFPLLCVTTANRFLFPADTRCPKACAQSSFFNPKSFLEELHGTTIQTLSSQAKAVVMQDIINEKFDCIFCQQNHVQTTGNISRNVMEIVQHRNVSTHTSSSPYYSRDNCQLRQTGSRGACIWLLTFHRFVRQGNLQKNLSAN